MDPNRYAAYSALKHIEEKYAYSNVAVNRYAQKPGVTSQAFVRELVYGVLRHSYFLDYNIGRLLNRPDRRMPAGISILMRMGMYQLLFMESVSDYAAVDETVGMAAKLFKGRQGLVNAVLRTFVRNGKQTAVPDSCDAVENFSIRYSAHPDIVNTWIAAYGTERAQSLLESALCIPPLTMRVNTQKTTRAQLIEDLAGLGHSAKAGIWSGTALSIDGGDVLSGELYKRGHFSVQDESSQVAADVLDPKSGEYIVDMCAAPGGKSCASAERMQDQGVVRAFDVHAWKIPLIRDEAHRLGLQIIEASVWDGTVFDADLAGRADGVWVDAPCSGLGVLRRKPEIKQRNLDAVPALCDLQAALLANASHYVKPNGRLLYTTCTINPAENEEIVKAFCDANQMYRVEKECQLTPSEHGTDGFYICLMRRQHD